MKTYSVQAYSEGLVQLEDPPLAFDRGMNAITLVTEDIAGVLEQLRARGVRVDECNELAQDASFPEDLLLPGEFTTDHVPIQTQDRERGS